ncbi:MAG: helix-turn-helix transcriptional regulator [Clostridia bacterium]|nr:helix-turn-helix transcriptional regulator [Clostridia bacterium]
MNLSNEGLDITHIPVTRVTSAVYIRPNNILFTKNRRCFGIFYKLEGASECRIGSQSWIFDQSHVIILPMGCTYEIYPHEVGRSVMIEFLCSPDFEYDVSKVYSYELSNPGIIARLFSEAERVWTFKKTAFQNRCQSILYQIFAELEQESTRSYINSKVSAPIHAAQNYLESHYNDPALNTATLAEIAGLSQSYFRKLFLQIYRMSPGQYIQMIRMEKAKDLLGMGGYNVGEVAELVGYANIFYFSNAFKKAVGTSPSEYAARLQMPSDSPSISCS